MSVTRRHLLRLAGGGSLLSYAAQAAPFSGQLKIIAIRAMGIKTATGNCLIRVDTDAGISGYGEAGATAPMARARIETMKSMLIGKDPLSIERHFFAMTSLMHTYMAHIPTISGIDIALWDIAGKVLDKPVYKLLGGPFRDDVPMYSHGIGVNLLDKASCREWGQRIRQAPEGFKAYKIGIDPVLGLAPAKYANTLDREQLRKIAAAYSNAREAAGDDFDIAVHCHNEFDTPSAIAVAKAVEPADPIFLEDALNVPFSEGWMALKRSTRIPILTGEKLEMVSGFRPFLDHQAADIVHPDLAFAGGITGVRKIADYAALTRTPVAFHNVGTLVLTYASGHLAMSIQNFYRSESALGRATRQVEDMAASNPPVVRNSRLKIPDAPGLGLSFNEDFLRKNLGEGEPWWG